ncbi:hypothetical protein [Thalassospira sp. CH_XMU1458]|uniref:hypothetical protein n=1 Tax=Thalassospira sp. CH_XMU1458 TaxID=3107776 RepID=UPI00300CFB2F
MLEISLHDNIEECKPFPADHLLPQDFSNLVWIGTEKKFLEMSSGKLLARDQINWPDNAHSYFNDTAHRRIVSDAVFLPGKARFVTVNKRLCVNLWCTPPGINKAKQRSNAVTEFNIIPWLGYLESRIECPTTREVFLDWMANVLQKSERPSWGLALAASHEEGKILFGPLLQAFGGESTPARPTQLLSTRSAPTKNVYARQQRAFMRKTSTLTLIEGRGAQSKLYNPTKGRMCNDMRSPHPQHAYIAILDDTDTFKRYESSRRFISYRLPPNKLGIASDEAHKVIPDVAAWLIKRDLNAFDPRRRPALTP